MKSGLVLLIFAALIACAFCNHAIVIPGEELIDQSQTAKRTFGSGPALALVPKEFECDLGSNEQDFVAYTSDESGLRRQCSGKIIDVINEVFIPVNNMIVTEFFDPFVPVKGFFKNMTIGAQRDFIQFPDFGIEVLSVETSDLPNGRANYAQGRECSVPASELLQDPVDRLKPKDTYSRDWSQELDAQVDVAMSHQITRQNSTDGYRQYFSPAVITNLQLEWRFETAAGRNTGLTLLGSIPIPGTGEVALMTKFTCDAGVPYSADDFYVERGPWGTGLTARRNGPTTTVDSLSQAVEQIVAANRR